MQVPTARLLPGKRTYALGPVTVVCRATRTSTVPKRNRIRWCPQSDSLDRDGGLVPLPLRAASPRALSPDSDADGSPADGAGASGMRMREFQAARERLQGRQQEQARALMGQARAGGGARP